MRGFKSALLAIKMRLRAILYSPAFERTFDTFVLSFDAECFSELRSAEVIQENLHCRCIRLIYQPCIRFLLISDYQPFIRLIQRISG